MLPRELRRRSLTPVRGARLGPLAFAITALVLACLPPRAAFAHASSSSVYSKYEATTSGQTIAVVFAFDTPAVLRVLQRDAAARVDRANVDAYGETFARYLFPRFSISNGGRPCEHPPALATFFWDASGDHVIAVTKLECAAPLDDLVFRSTVPKQADNIAASVDPPGGLTPNQVPMFVMFGSDDNYYADGVDWLVDTAFAGKTNPDGSPAQITLFITSGGATSSNGGVFTPGSVGQTEQQVLSSWQNAYAKGHQVGNHTWDHDKSDSTAGNSYTSADWKAEIDTSQAFLTSLAAFPACELDGWRFPYLAFDDQGFQTYASAGFLFDASVEFGYNWWQPPGSSSGFGPGSPESGKHFW